MGRRKVIGNPDWVEFLEDYKAKLIEENPDNKLQYTYSRAIKALKDCPDTQTEPGQIKVKYVGPTIIGLLKKEIAAGRLNRPVNGYDSLQSSAGSTCVNCDLRARAGSDPISAADAVRTIPRFTAKQKGKGKATIFNPREDAALQAVAGRFANPAFARAHQAESNVPKQPSAEALHKVAAVEEALLVGLYTQCHETSQKIWKTEQELLLLAEPWMTHQTSVIAPRLIALTSRKHLEMHFRGNEPVYSFTWAGYCSAQQYAQGKGLPAIEITRNDLTVPQVLAPQISVTQGKAIPDADLHDSVRLAPANTVRQHATKQAKQMQTVPVPAPSTIARPSGIVSVNRSAPAAGNFTTILPRKRPAAVEESYQGLSQYTRSAAEAIAGEAAPVPAVTHRPINKRFAAPSIASVFQDKPVTAPAAHSDDENNIRVSTPGEADVKPHPENGTMMYKVEYRARQARHPLAKIVLDKTAMTRTPPDPKGLTEYGWISASKALAKCPGIGSLKETSGSEAQVAAPVKKVSRTSTIASLMAGSTQAKKKDMRAMYKFPSLDNYDFDRTSSSPEKPKATIQRVDPTKSRHRPSGDLAFKTNEELIKTIFSSSSKSAAVTGTASTNAPVTEVVKQTPAALSSPSMSTVIAQVASTSGTRPLPPAAPVPTESFAPASPTITAVPAPLPVEVSDGGYTRSYSWAMEDHLTFPDFQPITLQPDSFHVVLQFDHRELGHESGPLEEMLRRKGVNYEKVGNLRLGDYLWVARRKIRRGDGYDDIVLAICERKRKDDFVLSIKDDRHINQKRRIKAAGIKRCFYLVEEYDISMHSETFTKSIQTSINQTLLMDGFSLHVAGSFHEVMAHLVHVTRALEQERSPLFVIPNDRVQHAQVAALQRYLERKDPDKIYCISRSSFDRVSKPQITVKTIWANQIRHVHGVSEEQCVDFLHVYPTPSSFFEDLEYRVACEAGAGERDDLAGTKKRKMHHSDPRNHVKSRLEPDGAFKPRPMCGPTSAKLWQLGTANDYYTDRDLALE